MTSKVVKCPTCNIVINEVLAFVSNKIDVVTEETISSVCVSAFSERDISDAKNLLYDSIPTTTRNIPRKGTRKTIREIDDIIWVFKNTIAEERPIFVAKDLHKLPPLLFDHLDVTKLLKDILLLRQELKLIKEQYATAENLDLLRVEVDLIKNKSQTKFLNTSTQWSVNKGRGAFIDNYELNSGPIGLPPISYDDEITGESSVSLSENVDENTYRDIVQPACLPECINTLPLPPLVTPHLQPGRSAESGTILSACEVPCNNIEVSHAPATDSLVAPLAASLLRAFAQAPIIKTRTPPSVTARLPQASDSQPSASVRSSSAAELPSSAAVRPSQTAARSPQTAALFPPAKKRPPQVAARSPPAVERPPSGAKLSPPTIAQSDKRDTRHLAKDLTLAEIVRGGEFKQETHNSEWTLIQKKRLRNRFVGNRGNAVVRADEKFKAADVKTPIYIYDVAKNVAIKDIASYIENKSGLNVVIVQMKMKLQKEYNAFKIFVPKHKLSLFLSDDFWPKDIAYRRFIEFHDKSNVVNNSTVRPLNVANG